MSNKILNQSLVEIINDYRSNPVVNKKKFQTISKALRRTKQIKRADFLNDYASQISSIPAVNTLKVSKGLQKTAEEKLVSIIKASGNLKSMTDKKLQEIADTFTESNEGIVTTADEGDADFILSRIITSKIDKDNDNFYKHISSGDFKYMGVASAEYTDDAITVIIFAKNVCEIQEEDLGDDQDLKEAFDLFDVWKTGKLEMKLLLEAFESLGFEKDSFSVYKLIANLNANDDVRTTGGVDWPTFRSACHELVGGLNSKEELRTLFELIVDSPDQEVISADTLKRVAREIGDNISYQEIVDVMKRSATNGVDMEFEEFYKIMENYKDLNKK